MYTLVSPFSKTFDTVGLLYFVPDFLEGEISLGAIVEVPIGSKIENAVVLQMINHISDFCIQYSLSIDEEKVKSIIAVVTQKSLISEYNIGLAQFIAEHYFSQIHHSINLFFPAIVRKKIKNLDEKFFEVLRGDNQEEYVNNDFVVSNRTFSEAQYNAYDEIEKNFENNNTINLLYGVTGSGKTEIYIQLIAKALQSGGQALLLIPEIILNNQIGEKIQKIFGERVININSSVTDTKKQKCFLQILQGTSCVVVGTRSALFYPYKNLELLIVDEEHDKSYNSDKVPRYKSIEVIQKMIQIHPSLHVLLGSGTPSIESMYKAVKGEWNLINLLEKYNKK